MSDLVDELNAVPKPGIVLANLVTVFGLLCMVGIFLGSAIALTNMVPVSTDFFQHVSGPHHECHDSGGHHKQVPCLYEPAACPFQTYKTIFTSWQCRRTTPCSMQKNHTPSPCSFRSKQVMVIAHFFTVLIGLPLVLSARFRLKADAIASYINRLTKQLGDRGVVHWEALHFSLTEVWTRPFVGHRTGLLERTAVACELWLPNKVGEFYP